VLDLVVGPVESRVVVVTGWGDDRGEDTGRFSKAELEGGEPCRAVNRVHDVKAYLGQGLCPSFLVVLDREMDALDDGFIGSFAGTIAFWVEAG
jgi:hypothetical protein